MTAASTYLALAAEDDGDGQRVPAYLECEFRRCPCAKGSCQCQSDCAGSPEREPQAISAVLRILLRVIEAHLCRASWCRRSA